MQTRGEKPGSIWRSKNEPFLAHLASNWHDESILVLSVGLSIRESGDVRTERERTVKYIIKPKISDVQVASRSIASSPGTAMLAQRARAPPFDEGTGP